ncbi:MAG: transcriptional regulator [Dehalococcoides mccartyi]|nr:MAG: transcriptional regulator [Dehalococcoides mccartyi]
MYLSKLNPELYNQQKCEANMSLVNEDGKQNCSARLLKVEHLLYQNPNGIQVKDIARLCQVSKRTAYRDLNELETTLKIPLITDKNGYHIADNYFLPPIHFTLTEGLSVFLATRLLFGYSCTYNPDIESTFTKLNSVMPAPFQHQISQTLDKMHDKAADKENIQTMALLCRAWAEQRKVQISYWTLGKKDCSTREVSPYFIEPAAAGHSAYLIGHCGKSNEMRTFKLERIQSIKILDDKYAIPRDFDIDKYHSPYWGILVDGEVKDIKLKFTPEVGRIMTETIFHPSQVNETLPDQSVLVSFRLADTPDFVSWVLSWGERVEVLEPRELRVKVIETAREMLKRYGN